VKCVPQVGKSILPGVSYSSVSQGKAKLILRFLADNVTNVWQANASWSNCI
jgi:hypothetical protein